MGLHSASTYQTFVSTNFHDKFHIETQSCREN